MNSFMFLLSMLGFMTVCILSGGYAMEMQVKAREKKGVKGNDRFKMFNFK